ncbi:S8 family serine peptidase [Parvularcula sp. ZS-1/3]|uniref:S8 family serine peptidase n=1 Tax=Parvularcula mediterranea TaxID=2732508 RepID=A0A7Y3W4U2_9PROT|nr:S8 family peptidase [Parvularcula mediterranea]NNU15607.1 S8 family serine peptidase [Parvularcula mediterranea]
MWRKTLLTTVAGAAIVASPALAQAEEPRFEPRFGDIQAFSGDFHAFYLDISPFMGDLQPFMGDIQAFGRDFHPFLGDITPFYGSVSPLWGNIEPFWGVDIQPFAGDLHAFWGDLTAFRLDIQPFMGDIQPFFGDIHAFEDNLRNIGDYWAAAGPAWGEIYAEWTRLRDAGASKAEWEDFERNYLDPFFAEAEAVWGDALGSKWNGTLKDLLDEYGIDLRREQNMANVDGATLSEFFLAYYDSLMATAGIDMVDHWMPMINWRPSITQDQGMGVGADIGLIDARILPEETAIEYIQQAGGHEGAPSIHGAAVASIMAARHDGQGVMGIAPGATVHAYNPFDHTGTASASDVAQGVRDLAHRGVGVINMSLGVPGYTLHQDIADMLTTPNLSSVEGRVVIVTAAGNDGVAQTDDIDWDHRGISHESLLVVGSVGLTGEISSFSNTPGTACINVRGGDCGVGERLMDRFLVAPGELILVSDNAGGTTRASGTSFAAPMVTGTIALIQDYWPWMNRHAETTADIILQTATDLGEAGVDEVYGHGLLNVEAALSPLNFNDLVIYLDDGVSGWNNTAAVDLAAAAIDPGQLDLWEASGASIYAYEFVGDTFRDFEIPLSTLLHGQQGIFENYQRHVQRQMMQWANKSSQHMAATQTLAANDFWSLEFTQDGTTQGGGMLTFTSQDRGIRMVAGLGNQMQGLSTVNGFDGVSDYEVTTGGANPMLGLASGGGYAALSFELDKALTMTFGYTGTPLEQVQVDQRTGLEMDGDALFGRRDALAATAELAFQATEKLRVGAAVTSLNEERSALGSAGAGALSMTEDALTTGLTMSAVYDLTSRISLAASATGARTNETDTANGGLGVADQGLDSSAFQVKADVFRLLSERDRLTLSAAQPLRVEDGAMRFTSVQVTDRTTGDTGLASDDWQLGQGPRHLAFEADYSVSSEDNRWQLGVYSRFDLNDVDIQGRFNELSAGARIAVTF